MLYPLPAVLVTTSDKAGRDNIFTVAWTGTVCTNPPMLSISVRPSRYSYELLRKTGEFVVNLTNEDLSFAVDYCGVCSGRDVDKFQKLKLHKDKADEVCAPLLQEAPVSIECRVDREIPLGSHTLFLAKVLKVHVDKRYLDKNGKFQLNKAGMLVYSHGEYLVLGKSLGTFGYSIKKQKKRN